MTEEDELRNWFGVEVDTHMDSCYGMAYRLTRNRTEAEDLVAEAVAKAWSCIASLEDKRRFRPWLFRILHNCFVSDYRKKSVRPRESPYDEQPVAAGANEISDLLIMQPDDFMHWWANPEKEFVNGLLAEDIKAALDALPDAFRITVLLVNVEGLSYDDAADVLDVPPGTVRSRMKRGRTLLQKALWQQAVDAGLAVEQR